MTVRGAATPAASGIPNSDIIFTDTWFLPCRSALGGAPRRATGQLPATPAAPPENKRKPTPHKKHASRSCGVFCAARSKPRACHSGSRLLFPEKNLRSQSPLGKPTESALCAAGSLLRWSPHFPVQERFHSAFVPGNWFGFHRKRKRMAMTGSCRPGHRLCIILFYKPGPVFLSDMGEERGCE